jgi:hypothetical protein
MFIAGGRSPPAECGPNFNRGRCPGVTTPTGQIPANIGDLQHLKTLCLNNNKLSGPLPASIGSLADLEVIKLSFNRLQGPSYTHDALGLTSY